MATNTFIRAAEYWVPAADGSLLEFGGGLFGNATASGRQPPAVLRPR